MIKKRQIKFEMILGILLFGIIFNLNFLIAQSSNSTSIHEWLSVGRTIDGARDYPENPSTSLSNFTLLFSNTSISATQSFPAIYENIIYYCDNNNYLVAYNLSENDTLVWNFNVNNILCSPAINKEERLIYVGARSPDYTYALDLDTGSIVWNSTLSSTNENPLVLIDGIVYIASDNGFFMYNGTTGDIIYQNTSINSYSPTPVYSDEKIYFGDDSGIVRALNYRTGEEIWSFDSGSGDLDSNVIVENGIAIVPSTDNYVWGLNASNGNYIWNYSNYNYVYGYPAYSNGIVYIGAIRNSCDGDYLALNITNGNEIWRVQNYSSLSNAMTVWGDYVISYDDGCGANNIKLLFFNKTDGSEALIYDTGNPAGVNSNGIGIVDDTLYSLFGGLYIYGFPIVSHIGETVLVTADYQTTSSGLTGQVVDDTISSMATTINWFPIIIIITAMIILIVLTLIIIKTLKGGSEVTA